jgi:hypothetical protein
MLSPLQTPVKAVTVGAITGSRIREEAAPPV